MIYDNYGHVNEVYAPVHANIVIRSKGNPTQRPIDSDDNETNTQNFKPRNYTSSANGQRLDLSKFTQKLASITRTTSTAKCAKSIRVALQSAGANIQNHPVAAADWGDTLKKIGYRQINPSFNNPKKGDIYIIDRTGSHTYGHIAGYSGSNWVSDFKQSDYAVYKNKNVKYSYYRLDD